MSRDLWELRNVLLYSFSSDFRRLATFAHRDYNDFKDLQGRSQRT